MKNFVAFLMCLVMLLSIFSCDIENTNNNENNGTNNDRIPTADYSGILNVCRDIIEILPNYVDSKDAMDNYCAELGFVEEEEKELFVKLFGSIFDFMQSPPYALSCGYAQKDLNGDGVDELVLMNKDYYIMAILSFANGKPVLLGNYWQRNSCWIDGDGLLHNGGSNGADQISRQLYKISDGGEELELISEFGINGHEWIDDIAYTKYYELVGGEKVSITENKFHELEQHYSKYLGSLGGPAATKQYSGLVFTPLYTEAEIAMKMYEAAINDEICVVDESLCEIKLEDCRFPSDNLRLGECEILSKAILDMDGDGINEYIIQSETKDHIVLHYYNGKVYSYCFDSSNFYNLNTDGSFYWIDSGELNNCTRGHNQIAFDESLLNIKEIYRIKQTSPYDYGDDDHEYYVDGKQITREEFLDYYDSNCISKTSATFSPLDVSCEYPISSEKAYEIASNYWGFESGMDEGAAGTIIVNKIVILEKPNNDTLSYHICWQMEGYTNHVSDGWYSLPPKSVIMHKELFVDAITGECRE